MNLSDDEFPSLRYRTPLSPTVFVVLSSTCSSRKKITSVTKRCNRYRHTIRIKSNDPYRPRSRYYQPIVSSKTRRDGRDTLRTRAKDELSSFKEADITTLRLFYLFYLELRESSYTFRLGREEIIDRGENNHARENRDSVEIERYDSRQIYETADHYLSA